MQLAILQLTINNVGQQPIIWVKDKFRLTVNDTGQHGGLHSGHRQCQILTAGLELGILPRPIAAVRLKGNEYSLTLKIVLTVTDTCLLLVCK